MPSKIFLIPSHADFQSPDNTPVMNCTIPEKVVLTPSIIFEIAPTFNLTVVTKLPPIKLIIGFRIFS